jgi:hypothetical protein
VDDLALNDRPPTPGLEFEFGKPLTGHFRVGFVIECDGLPFSRPFSRRAQKQQHGPGGWVTSLVDERGRVNRLVGELNHGQFRRRAAIVLPTTMHDITYTS